MANATAMDTARGSACRSWQLPRLLLLSPAGTLGSNKGYCSSNGNAVRRLRLHSPLAPAASSRKVSAAVVASAAMAAGVTSATAGTTAAAAWVSTPRHSSPKLVHSSLPPPPSFSPTPCCSRSTSSTARKQPRTGTTAAATAAGAATAASSSHMGLLAVLLGYGCLVGSCFRSVPQIAAILRAGGSAEGLSLTSNLVELACFTVTVAYNVQQGYAFNTYGEVFACWIQDLVIVGLIFRHMRLSGPVVAAAAAVFAAGCVWLFSGGCPMQLLSALQLSTVGVMAVGARLPQIWLNLRRGNAGVLAPATCALNVAGCLVRVFTTLVLTRDVIILGGCVTQLLLNAILLYQAIATPGTPHHHNSTSATTTAAVAAAAAPPTDTPSNGSGGGSTGSGFGAATAASVASATAASVASAAAAAVAATDPPTGGAGPARGQAAAVAAGRGQLEGEGEGGGSSLGTAVPLPA